MERASRSVLADVLVERGYHGVEPLKSISGHAAIFKVQETEEEGAEQYVAKVVSLLGLDAKGRASAQQEVSLLKGLCSHPNLIAYRQSFMEEAGQLYIVMSLADGGDLRCVVAECTSRGHLIPEPIVVCWAGQTLSGLGHLHSQGVVHRDLKSSNIFLCQRRRLVRIGDFGISRVLESTAFATSCVGTPAYMSPELMRSERYDHHIDMWAMGCIIFELCTLKLPFSATSLLDLAMQVLEAEPIWSYWPEFSEELRVIAARLLQKDPEARPNAVDLLVEPFFGPGGPGSFAPPEQVWGFIDSEVSVYPDGSSSAESSAHLSRAEFNELLCSHHTELLADLQGSRSAGGPAAAAAGAAASRGRVAESLV